MKTLKSLLLRIVIFMRAAFAAVTLGLVETFGSARGRRVLALLSLAAVAALLITSPPFRTVSPGTSAVRINRLTGSLVVLSEGPVLLLPGLHELRSYPLRDQVYRPGRSATSAGDGAFQSIEGLSVGVDVTVRYALDPTRIEHLARRLPDRIGADLIEPVVDGILHRTFSRRSVREIFTAKRADIQTEIEVALRTELQPDGVIVRALFLGHVDLPPQYKSGIEGLLAEELAGEKMKYTLEIKQKRIKESEFEALAAKVQREHAAEAAGQEEIIAARSRAEAMKHVLPLKEKEIEQRRLEAEARKVTRMKDAEGNAEARKIESGGESEARRKLADAEAYRIDAVGKASSAQMARDSALIAKNPLLIQKTLADKLSDKIQVIVAPPKSGGFFAANLLGESSPPHKVADDKEGDADERQAQVSQ